MGTFRTDYAFNEADQRTNLTYPGGTAAQQGEVVSYGYNAVGQLTAVSGSGVQYVSSAMYNAQGQLTEMRNDSGANGLTRQFVYAPGGLPNTLRRTSYASDNGVFYLLQDHFKSTSALVNQNGTFNYECDNCKGHNLSYLRVY